MIKNKFIIFLMGPTASGKSKLAMVLRKYLPIDLISVDSALIYKDMNIGTSKPTKIELIKHPHRLINFKDPKENYSVVEFRHDALQSIHDILKIGRIPLLVGGTMFYYYILLNGIPNLPKPNIILRNEFYKYYNTKNVDMLYKYLSMIDIDSAHNIHPNDFNRIVRALEICLMSGSKTSILQKKTRKKLLYTVLQFAILPNQKDLYYNIKNRFFKMLYNGFENEVKKLFLRGDLNLNTQSINCIGYRQMWQYLSNKISYHDMVYKSIFATQNLCKKQITWLRKWKNVHFLYDQDVNSLISQILNLVYKYCIKYV